MIEGLHHLVRQRALLQVREVAFELFETADTNNDTVVTVFADTRHAELGVMYDPAQSGLKKSQVMLLDDRLNVTQSLKGRILEVAVAIHLALPGVGS